MIGPHKSFQETGKASLMFYYFVQLSNCSEKLILDLRKFCILSQGGCPFLILLFLEFYILEVNCLRFLSNLPKIS